MKLLSKFFLAVLLLTVSSVSWAACPEGTKNNYKGECLPVAGGSTESTTNDSNDLFQSVIGTYEGKVTDNDAEWSATTTIFQQGDLIAGTITYTNGTTIPQTLVQYDVENRALKFRWKSSDGATGLGVLWFSTNYESFEGVWGSNDEYEGGGLWTGNSVLAEAKKKQQEAKRLAEAKKKEEEAKRLAEAKKKEQEAKRAAEAKKKEEEAKRLAEKQQEEQLPEEKKVERDLTKLIGTNLCMKCYLSGANLEGAFLSGANLEGAVLIGANLKKANLYKAWMRYADLRDANFTNATLGGTDLFKADLAGTVLSGANLTGANLSGANLSGANLTGANLSGVALHQATLTDVIIDKASITDNKTLLAEIERQHEERLAAEKERDRKNLLSTKSCPQCNLDGMDLSDEDLSGANMSHANLDGANLKSANLKSANLTGANLTGANLIGANLTGANLTGAYLGGATLTDIIIDEAVIKTNITLLAERKRIEKKEEERLAEEKRKEEERLAEEKRKEQRKIELERVALNPGFRDLKPGLTSEEIMQMGVCGRSGLTTSFDTCYDLDNMKFQGWFMSGVLQVLRLDRGPVVQSQTFFGKISDHIDDGDIVLSTRKALSKYEIDYQFSERDRQLYNEQEKDKLYIVYEKGQVALLLTRVKKSTYDIDNHLFVEYRGPETAKQFLENNRPKKATSSDF